MMKKSIEKLIKLSNPNKYQKTIFVWPEAMLSSTYLNEITKYKEIFSQNFSENHLIIFGIQKIKYIKNEKHIYNSLVVVDKNFRFIS